MITTLLIIDTDTFPCNTMQITTNVSQSLFELPCLTGRKGHYLISMRTLFPFRWPWGVIINNINTNDNDVSQSLFELPCLTGRKGRDGTFPASACIKLTGIYDDTGEVRQILFNCRSEKEKENFILRLCEIYNTTSQGDDSARVFPWLGHSHDRHRADENQQLWGVLLWREVRYRIHRSFYISSHVSSGLDISYL